MELTRDREGIQARWDAKIFDRVLIGRRVHNGAERLEKLFELYTKMTTKVSA